MADIIRERDYRNDVPRRTSTNWGWLLLLPLFFIGGWFANDAINGVRPSTNIIVPGVGGGPGTTASPNNNMNYQYDHSTGNNTYGSTTSTVAPTASTPVMASPTGPTMTPSPSPSAVPSSSASTTK